MAVSAKIINTRIKSVTNIKKITKAMEMISAVKMKKSVEATLNTRTYARLAQELMEHVSTLDEPDIPLLDMRPVKKMLVVLISSNRGLCGSFNANVHKKTQRLLQDTKNIARHRVPGAQDIMPENGVEIDVVGIGRRSATFAKRYGYRLTELYDNLDDKPKMDQVMPVAQSLIKAFKKKEYDKVVVAYTDFKSTMVQEPKMRQLLPLSAIDIEKMIQDLGAHGERTVRDVVETDEKIDIENYLFEPGLEAIIDMVFPRLVEIQLYQSILESTASEHSSRMLAMKNATEAAGDMMKELNLTYNKARQSSITQEIAEIAGGAAALE